MDVNNLKLLIREDFSCSFEKFACMLKENNKKFNITSVCDDEGIFYRHFLDSIAGEEYFEEGAKIAEIGSGGGFPSIPLKIIRDDLRFTLIESTGKKCNFLKEVVKELNLKDVEVLNIRAEDGAKRGELREKFDVCCARAVAPLNTLVEYCLPYVKTGGFFIAYKGDCDDEIKEAANAVRELGGSYENIVRYDLENCGKRTLVIIKKISRTPVKYPRGNGKERKNPIK